MRLTLSMNTLLTPIRHPMLAQTLPNFSRSDRDIDMAHAQMPQRIDNRVGDSCRSAHRGRLTNPFRAQWMMRRWRASFVRLPFRRFDGCWQEIIHKASALNISDLIVVDLFVHRRSEPHRQPTVDLAFDNHRVDDIAAIVHGNEAPNLHLPGSLVNIDHANIAAEGIGQVRWIVIRDGFETGLHPLGMIGISRKSDLLDRLGLRRIASHEELARLPIEIYFIRLQQVGGDLFRLVENFPRCYSGRGPCRGRAAACIGSEPVRSRIRIPFFYCDMVHWDAQFLCENLRVGGLVTLPLRFGPKAGDDFSCRMNADLGAIEHLDAQDVEVFRWPGAHDLGEAGDADSH